MSSIISSFLDFVQGNEANLHQAIGTGMIGFGAFSFAALLFVTAPYGRYSPSSNSWGPLIPAKLAWIVQECPTLINAAYFFFLRHSDNPAATSSIPNIVLLSYFVLHYINRTLIFPFKITGGKPTPLSLVLMAFGFCAANGYLQARHLTYFRVYDSTWLTDPRFILGSAMFFTGWYINHDSDSRLLKLRSSNKDGGYKIPYGGMFEYVSGANFFGEILEWTGFAVATWSFPGLAFAIGTFTNLAPRAISHHNWYKSHFKKPILQIEKP